MSKSRLVLAGTALAVMLLGSGPSRAADAFAAFEVARAAGAVLSSDSLYGEAFGFNGVAAVTGPGLISSQYGCAAVAGSDSESYLIDVGCGRVSVTVDPLLRTARLRGTLRSFVYDYASDNRGHASRIVVDLTFSGSGLIRPIVSEGQFTDVQPVPPAAFLFASVGAGAGRGAVAKGSLTSATLGELVGATEEAAIFEGTNVSLGAFV